MNCALRIMDPPDVSKLLPLVAKAVKISQELPSANTPAYVYYNDFPRYKTITSGQSRKVLSIVQNLLDLLDARTNVVDMSSSKVHRDKFESVVDANDRLLERLSVAMDLEEDPIRKSSSLDVDLVLATHYKQNTSLKWLKSKAEEPHNGPHADTSDTAFTLLSSPNISRPQSYFSTPVDNSLTPFRPKLVRKPNSIVPLPESIKPTPEDTAEYLHPYQVELEHFATRISNWKPLLPESFALRPLDSHYEFVDRLDQLQKLIEEISTHHAVAVDLEHHSFRTYLGMTCLIQITTSSKDYIIDALALRDHLVQLNEVFTNPDIVKVFHGSDQDLMWFQRDFSVYVVNLFDSHLASRALQLGRHSLSYLLHHYANVQTNKKYQLADWRIRPLPDALIEYARTDTHYLLYIAAVMCQELQDRGLLPIVLERSRQLCLKLYVKPTFDPVGYLKLYKQTAGISFTHRQLYALEHLYAIRDSIARREDESVHYVLPNHMLKVIAEVLPRESSGLFACCNPIPPLVRKYVHDLHKIVLDARNLPVEKLPLTEATNFSEGRNQSGTNVDTAGATIEQVQYEAATPHDRCHTGCARFELPSLTPAAQAVKKPSALGQTIGLVEEISSSNPEVQNPSRTGLPLFLDANRMLLTKLLILLKSRVTYSNVSERNAVKTEATTTLSDKRDSVDSLIKTTAEPIIKLEFESSTSLFPAAIPNAAVKPELDSHHGKESIVCSSAPSTDLQEDSSFDPDEVVILREETVKQGKRARKRGRLAAGSSKQSLIEIPLSDDEVDSSHLDTHEAPDSTDLESPTRSSPSGVKKRQCTQPNDSSTTDISSPPQSSPGRGRGRGRARHSKK
ncbi:Exosome component 10 [Fasciola hepatica]|uniref:Exosome component 10 n=1 Tax=Fasciola hepatica TaxID=6192 RepID=A0A4E0RC12_FASHE|nr:Exosome component 10 [Fasciola hepatica]